MYFNWSHLVLGFLLVLVMVWVVIREREPESRMGYSKFRDKGKDQIKCGSRQGMLLIYGPSLVSSLALFGFQKSQGSESHVERLTLLLVAHYMKRVLEVLFVHSYSGYCDLKDSLKISGCYLGYALFLFGWTLQVPVQAINVYWTQVGLVLFVLGECINGYHHLLLKKLRTEGSRDYQIPQHGLFKYVWCPHYLGEMMSFMALFLISQHGFVLIAQLGSSAYLAIRAYNTKQWYKEHFQKIPERCCVIPFLY